VPVVIREALAQRLQPSWPGTRCLWAVAALATWLPRSTTVAEVYAGGETVLPSPVGTLTPLDPLVAWAHLAVLLVGVLVVLAGRRARLGLTLFLLASGSLLLHEGLNIKAYDRLLAWQALILLCAPGGGRGDRVGAPFAQVALALLYASLYGANGWFKALSGAAWWDGPSEAARSGCGSRIGAG
jgi:hypothetical protein